MTGLVVMVSPWNNDCIQPLEVKVYSMKVVSVWMEECLWSDHCTVYSSIQEDTLAQLGQEHKVHQFERASDK